MHIDCFFSFFLSLMVLMFYFFLEEWRLKQPPWPSNLVCHLFSFSFNSMSWFSNFLCFCFLNPISYIVFIFLDKQNIHFHHHHDGNHDWTKYKPWYFLFLSLSLSQIFRWVFFISSTHMMFLCLVHITDKRRHSTNPLNVCVFNQNINDSEWYWHTHTHTPVVVGVHLYFHIFFNFEINSMNCTKKNFVENQK